MVRGVNSGPCGGASAPACGPLSVAGRGGRGGRRDLDRASISDGQSETLGGSPVPTRGVAVHLAPTERQLRLRAELRAYFRDVMPDGPPPPADSAAQRRLLRRIGGDGMLGLGWPEEYGGQGRGPDE